MKEERLENFEEFKTKLQTCASNCQNCIMFWPTAAPCCPSRERHDFISYSSKGRSGLIYAYVSGQIDLTDDFAHVMYSCCMCGACREACVNEWSKTNIEAFEAMRSEFVANGKVPPEIRDFLRSIDRYGNPYVEKAADRGNWAHGLQVPLFSGQEYLLFIGCVASYDERGKKIARAIAEVLQKAGIQFGILGQEETCEGNEVKRAGDKWLFQQIAKKNIGKFNERNIRKIITVDPHAFNALKNEYLKLGAQFEVQHYTQFMSNLIKENRLNLTKNFDFNVTYHDPCYLGRFNEEYEAPRKILTSIPGLRLVEMARSRNHSFCCGGGGTNFFTDFNGGSVNSPERQRVNEALESQADVVAVACPQCAKMLEEGIKANNLENQLAVKDIAEIVNQVIG